MDFSIDGRTRRKEFWKFYLYTILGFIPLTLLIALIGEASPELAVFITGVYCVIVILLELFISIRRLHDIGKSGWMILLRMVPLVNFILQLVLLFSEGDKGANKYGADPKEGTKLTFEEAQ